MQNIMVLRGEGDSFCGKGLKMKLMGNFGKGGQGKMRNLRTTTK